MLRKEISFHVCYGECHHRRLWRLPTMGALLRLSDGWGPVNAPLLGPHSQLHAALLQPSHHSHWNPLTSDIVRRARSQSIDRSRHARTNANKSKLGHLPETRTCSAIWYIARCKTCDTGLRYLRRVQVATSEEAASYCF